MRVPPWLAALLLTFTLTGCKSAYQFDWGAIQPYMLTLASGARYTLLVSALGIVLGSALGLIIALLRMSTFKVFRYAAISYIEIMRCTPLLVQLVWIYYALPMIVGIQLSALSSAVLTLVLGYGAFYGEAFRSGLQAVPQDEINSAKVLGLSYAQRLKYVILPHAFRTVLPVLISLSVGLFKDSSLVSVIGVADLLYQANLVSSITFRPLETLTTVAALYFSVAVLATMAAARLEKKLSVYRIQR